MNKNQWLKAKDCERRKYLLNGEVIIKRKSGIKPDSKVGDNDACVTMFAAFIGIVQISQWLDSNREAMYQAINTLNIWESQR